MTYSEDQSKFIITTNGSTDDNAKGAQISIVRVLQKFNGALGLNPLL